MNDDNDTTRNLGFRIGSHVAFSHMFFANHRSKFVDLGVGTVIGKQMPDSNTLPKLIIRFPYNKSFFTEKLLNDLVVTSESKKGIVFVLIKVHPMYLEKRK